MTIYDGLALIGGLCLFLFGMNIMGEAFGKMCREQIENHFGENYRE